MNLKSTIEHLLRFFQQEGIDYALIGAFALKAYGYSRATQDVDFLVRIEDQQKIIRHLESLGYETLYSSRGFSHHLHPLSRLGRVDFVYVAGDTADVLFAATRCLLLLDEISIPVVKLEHLIALKVYAMQNDPDRTFQEMADIQHLMRVPGIDRDEVRGYFARFGQLEKYYELTGKNNKTSQP
jgi:predicted nucleotidyltransferase